MALDKGQHIMLSYQHKSKDIVKQVNGILKASGIQTWMDEDGGITNDLFDGMTDGVENASVVCCFLTPDYQNSKNCLLEITNAQLLGKHIVPCMLCNRKQWKPSHKLGFLTRDKLSIDFADHSEDNIRKKANELINRIKNASQPISQPNKLSGQIIDESQATACDTIVESNDLFELIKSTHECNSRIHRIMNKVKSFPIAQSYINLAMIETKEVQKEEKKLRGKQQTDTIINTFEEIYGKKISIEIKNIFKTCKEKTRKVLVLGRAGIGKSTFCRYVAYQWATGVILSEYDLVVVIPLRSLTTSRYPSGINYTLVDLVKKEYFSNQTLSENEEKVFRLQFDKSRVLWLLDGYDEIVGNIPEHLQHLLDKLLHDTHHILMSRPYRITLPYDVEMEIIGFTDDNIVKYVKQFFDQIKDQSKDISSESQKLLKFLKSNPSIWGIAHIPVNLELICSLWGDTDWSETKALTVTALYDKINEWLCRRYLIKQEEISTEKFQSMRKRKLYENCKRELAFLESLAFHGMEDNSIILRPQLLEKAETETGYSLDDHLELLNIGILKALNDKATGTAIEAEKDHYFVHLSFQEHFAARYLVNALKDPTSTKAIDFIKCQKYNQRFALVFSFASGLLVENADATSIDTFWDTILAEPLDLVGLRHIQLIISCMEETTSSSSFKRHVELMNSIVRWIEFVAITGHPSMPSRLAQSFTRAPSLANDQQIQEILIKLLESEDENTKYNMAEFISKLSISEPSPQLIHILLTQLDDKDSHSRQCAYEALGRMGEKAVTSDVIHRLLIALGDEDSDVKQCACEALGKMGEKIATDDVINRLVTALGDDDWFLRIRACEALGEMGEKAVTNDVINALITALEDFYVRQSASEALWKMVEKGVTDDVVNRLLAALGNEDRDARQSVYQALEKVGDKATNNDVINRLVTVALESEYLDVAEDAGEALGKMGDKAATNDVINRLVTALGDENFGARKEACQTLGKLGEKSRTNDVINRLVIALGDENSRVRSGACSALGKMGEKGATDDVINRLVTALGDEDSDVRRSACSALGKMGEKVATGDVINRLVTALGDEDSYVRISACYAFEEMGEKVATDDVTNRLVIALGDENSRVRSGACSALEKMGEKVATDDVINRLVTALGDEDSYVRHDACRALGRIGEKSKTNDVSNRLVIALEDENSRVRSGACTALEKMGEKARSSDVLNRLVTVLEDKNLDVRSSACYALWNIGEKMEIGNLANRLATTLGDENLYVRVRACEVLGEMGEKAATADVINRLVTALGDENSSVRRKACRALGEMGEKVATDDVINRVVTALDDEDWGVKADAYEALGKMGEKAATADVINRLLTALEEGDSGIKSRACDALGKMGKKVATDDVINRLVIALGDDHWDVRARACEALVTISEKAATNDVINTLVIRLCENDSARFSVENVFERILASFSSVEGLRSDAIRKLVSWLNRGQIHSDLRAVPCEQFIKVFLHTKKFDWFPVWFIVAFLQGTAICLSEKVILVYGSKEVIELRDASDELLDKFVQDFKQFLEIGVKLYLDSMPASEIEEKLAISSSVCNIM